MDLNGRPREEPEAQPNRLLSPGMFVTIEPGTFFETFYIIAPLGEGGMSEVFLAFDFLNARLVAIKFLLGIHNQNPKTIARMRREGEIYRKLRHPSILSVYEIGTSDKIPVFLSLEFLRGDTLEDTLDDAEERPSFPMALRILEEMASALQAAHREGIIHRDVKPQNIMIRPDGTATIYDFGIAHAEDDLVQTQMGSILGTLSYSAPEQRRGLPTDHRADIFSLGAILYEMLTGNRVIEPGTYREMIQAETEFLPDPSEVRPGTPKILDEITRKMIADDRDQRYQDLKALLIQLGLMRVELDEATREILFGSSIEQRLDEAVKAFRAEEVDKAEDLLEDLIMRPPPSLGVDLFQLHSKILAKRGRDRGAIEALERAFTYEPGNISIILDLALLWIRYGRLDKARELISGSPVWVRGNLLIRSIMDVLNHMTEVPKGILERFPGSGPAHRFHRTLLEGRT